jgi:serine/threonine protein kinase
MADIWSLGCIVLEMLTGKRPWFNTEAIAVMYKVNHLDSCIVTPLIFHDT